MVHTYFYSSSLWPQVRNGQLGGNGTGIGTSPHCVPEGDRVLFFGATDDFTDTSVFQRAMTRMAVTKLLNLVPGELQEFSQPFTSGIREKSGCIDSFLFFS